MPVQSVAPRTQRISDSAKVGGLCFAAAGLLYLAAETISAAAWHTPPYSYARNYISDLGVAGCGILFHGRPICSPLHGLMNIGFMLEGLLFFIANLIVSGQTTRPWRFGIVMLGLLHGVGMLLVGYYHGSEAALEDGSLRYHLLGAQLAIVSGNVALIAYGCAHRQIGLSRRFASLSIVLGSVGLLSAVTLVSLLTTLPRGLLERGSVYSIMIWEIVTGSMMAWRNRSAKRRR
ncbi:DUF998 domain-containing protein [Robbsia sp. KACC 23696]|uniref:DUF998 domain-containing protein n=1 Tax=Robbsia sp. KACC 23696 TaxID=3149231 RepID=UPI00325B1AF8